MITLQIHKSQMKHLIQMIFISDWIINSIRQSGEINNSIRKLATQIYSELYQQGGQEFFMNDQFDNIPLTSGMTEECFQWIEAYSQDTFWDILAEFLAQRDIEMNYSEEEIRTMGNDKLRELYFDNIEKYEKEFIDHGVDNLMVVPQLPDNSLNQEWC